MKIKDTIGIDVSKLKVDVHVYSSKAIEVFENNDKDLKRMINMGVKEQ